jgi:hypothetical protein
MDSYTVEINIRGHVTHYPRPVAASDVSGVVDRLLAAWGRRLPKEFRAVPLAWQLQNYGEAYSESEDHSESISVQLAD